MGTVFLVGVRDELDALRTREWCGKADWASWERCIRAGRLSRTAKRILLGEAVAKGESCIVAVGLVQHYSGGSFFDAEVRVGELLEVLDRTALGETWREVARRGGRRRGLRRLVGADAVDSVVRNLDPGSVVYHGKRNQALSRWMTPEAVVKAMRSGTSLGWGQQSVGMWAEASVLCEASRGMSDGELLNIARWSGGRREQARAIVEILEEADMRGLGVVDACLLLTALGVGDDFLSRVLALSDGAVWLRYLAGCLSLDAGRRAQRLVPEEADVELVARLVCERPESWMFAMRREWDYFFPRIWEMGELGRTITRSVGGFGWMMLERGVFSEIGELLDTLDCGGAAQADLVDDLLRNHPEGAVIDVVRAVDGITKSRDVWIGAKSTY